MNALTRVLPKCVVGLATVLSGCNAEFKEFVVADKYFRVSASELIGDVWYANHLPADGFAFSFDPRKLPVSAKYRPVLNVRAKVMRVSGTVNAESRVAGWKRHGESGPFFDALHAPNTKISGHGTGKFAVVSPEPSWGYVVVWRLKEKKTTPTINDILEIGEAVASCSAGELSQTVCNRYFFFNGLAVGYSFEIENLYDLESLDEAIKAVVQSWIVSPAKPQSSKPSKQGSGLNTVRLDNFSEFMLRV